MSAKETGIITLLKSAITEESYTLPESFLLDEAVPVMRSHGIIPLCYMGAIRCGISKTEPAMQEMFKSYCASLGQSERQLAAVKTLFAAFEAQGIDYLPLKGCNMKALYPSPELRLMGDADILIRLEQYPQIREIMLHLGYTEGEETDHELDWTSQALYVELHKRLIPSYNKDYFAYYGNGWRLASCHDGHRYRMTPEDEFVYLFTHFAKHYRDGGIGCRHLLDLWVYLRSYPQLDFIYMRNELERLQLRTFFDHIYRTISAWFMDGAWDEQTEHITAFLFSGGSWGNMDNRSLARVVKASELSHFAVPSWVREYLVHCFPPARVIRERYGFFRRCPILLPLGWPVLWLHTLLFRRHAISTCVDSANQMKDGRAEDYQAMLDEVGLRFDFKE